MMGNLLACQEDLVQQNYGSIYLNRSDKVKKSGLKNRFTKCIMFGRLNKLIGLTRSDVDPVRQDVTVLNVS